MGIPWAERQRVGPAGWGGSETLMELAWRRQIGNTYAPHSAPSAALFFQSCCCSVYCEPPALLRRSGPALGFQSFPFPPPATGDPRLPQGFVLTAEERSQFPDQDQAGGGRQALHLPGCLGCRSPPLGACKGRHSPAWGPPLSVIPADLHGAPPCPSTHLSGLP